MTDGDQDVQNPYYWEHENINETIKDQIRTVNGISDNATRTLRIVLLSIAGIITGSLTLTLPSFPLHPVPILLSIGAIALGIFFLISATLGVSISLDHVVADQDVDEDAFSKLRNADSPSDVGYSSYLQTRLAGQLRKVERNEEVIEGNRRLMYIADFGLSIGIMIAMLLLVDVLNHVHGLVPAAIMHHVVPPLFVVLVFVAFVSVDRSHPEKHAVLDWSGSAVRGNARSWVVLLLILGISAAMFTW